MPVIHDMPRTNDLPADLNLLVVLDALLRERSVTAAGRAVGLTQPAMSNALRRLRNAFGDPLFVRAGGGMVPTPEAQRLGEPVRRALELLREGLAERPSFAPAEARRTFRLLLSDVGQIVALPRLVWHLAAEAPGCTLMTVAAPRDRHPAVLESGEADLAIGASVPPRAGLKRQHLFDDRYVLLARRDHPRIRGAPTLGALLQEAHLLVQAQGGLDSPVAALLRRAGLDGRVALRAPQYTMACLIAARTDLITIVPEEVMQELPASLGLRAFPLPFPTPNLAIHQYWHPRYDRDAGNRWLRAQIAGLLRNRHADAGGADPS